MCRTNNNLVALSPFKQLKKLKATGAQYGPNVSLIEMLLEYSTSEAYIMGSGNNWTKFACQMETICCKKSNMKINVGSQI